MTARADDAFTWEGDHDPTLDTGAPTAQPSLDTGAPTAEPTLPEGFTAVGKGSDTVDRTAPLEDDDAGEGGGEGEPQDVLPAQTTRGEREPMGNVALVTVGILGGFYLIFTIGWIIGGFRLQGKAHYAVSDVAFQGPFWLAVLAPALWFGTVFLLTAALGGMGADRVARRRRDPARPVAVHHGRGGGAVSDETMDGAPRGGSPGTGSTPSARQKNPTWLVATIAGGFGLFYAYMVWNALGNLIQAAPYGLNALGWFLWIFATVFPIVVFAAAFTVGFRRRPLHFVLVMLTGLALTAVFWLNVVAYTTTNTSSLLG